MNCEISSTPITTAFLTTPVRIIAVAVESPYRKLVQAARPSTRLSSLRGAPAGRTPGWDLVVEAAGTEDDQLDIRGVQTGCRQRAHGRDVAQFLEPDVRHAPLLDTGAARDPLVVRVEERGEVGIGQNGRRQACQPVMAA
jgi:hypothetical protein